MGVNRIGKQQSVAHSEELLDAHKVEIDGLNAEIADRSARIAQIQADSARQAQDLASARAELLAQMKTNQRLLEASGEKGAEAKLAFEQVSRLESDLARAGRDLADTKAQLESAKNQLDELDAGSMEKEREQRLKLESERDELFARVSEFEEEASALSAERDSLQSTSNVTAAQLSELVVVLSLAEEEVKTLRTSRDALQERLSSEKSAHEVTRETLKQEHQNLTSLQTECSELKQQAARNRTKLLGLQKGPLLRQASIYEADGDLISAFAAYAEIRDVDQADAEALAGIHRLRVRARAELEAALDQDDLSRAESNLLLARQTSTGDVDYEAALELLEGRVQSLSRKQNQAKEVKRLLAFATDAQEKGDVVGALEALHQAQKLGADSERVHRNVGQLLAQQRGLISDYIKTADYSASDAALRSLVAMLEYLPEKSQNEIEPFIADALSTIEIYLERSWSRGAKISDCSGCPEMVVLPSGDFVMGSEKTGYDNERPAHKRFVSRPFAISTHEITFRE